MSTYANILCLVIVSSLLVFSNCGNVCRGLVLQGGSDKGAYQAGALQGLLEKLGAEEISYDVISGVTIGAVNAAWLSQFPKGQEEQMIDELTNFWLTIKASDVYHDWIGGIIQGLLFEPSLYNTGPGMNYLKNHITQSPQRYVAIGTSDANTGFYKVFNNYNTSMDVDYFLKTVMASMGIAGVFPYVDIDDSTFIDGSILKSMDVATVVNQCRTLNGNDDSNIIIDMIMLNGKSLPVDEVDKFNALKVLIRTIEITSYHNAMYSLVRANQTFPDVQFRHVIIPSSPLPSSDLPISFDHDEIVSMMALGKQDAENAVAAGSGATFKEALEMATEQLKGRFGAPSVRPATQRYFAELDKLLKEEKARR